MPGAIACSRRLGSARHRNGGRRRAARDQTGRVQDHENRPFPQQRAPGNVAGGRARHSQFLNQSVSLAQELIHPYRETPGSRFQHHHRQHVSAAGPAHASPICSKCANPYNGTGCPSRFTTGFPSSVSTRSSGMRYSRSIPCVGIPKVCPAAESSSKMAGGYRQGDRQEKGRAGALLGPQIHVALQAVHGFVNHREPHAPSGQVD